MVGNENSQLSYRIVSCIWYMEVSVYRNSVS